MCNIDRAQLRSEATKLMHIVNTGELKIGGKLVDITPDLHKWNASVYRDNHIDDIDIKRYEKASKPCKYTVLADGSDRVAFNKRYTDKKICILNFASSKNPGGGFVTGAMAQEEALCQASNLYSILERHESFYEYNRGNLCKGLYTDGIIFAEDCCFFRNNYKNVEPKLVDVITCAAPNAKAARRNGVSEAEIECTMSRRIEQILKVAIANNVKVLALGAFGCGVFGNDPDKVASIMWTILEIRGYHEYFEEIVFPMNGTVGDNVKAFTKEFNSK